jgi:hypothetical protein
MSRESVGRIVTFQVTLAERWIRESNAVPPRFQFIGYFMAFNALYWLWGMLDNVTKDGEFGRVEHLVTKFDKNSAKRVVEEHAKYIDFLVNDRPPIRSMGTRSRTSEQGDDSDGRKFVERMRNGDPKKRLKGLAGALYLIRCNLVHGAKGPEEGLLVRSAPPMLTLAETCVDYTKHRPPQ